MFFQPLPTDTFWQHCRWIPTALNCCNQASMVTPVTSELDVTVSVLDVHHVKPTCLFVINLTNSTVPGWNSRLLCPPQMLPLCCHQTSCIQAVHSPSVGPSETQRFVSVSSFGAVFFCRFHTNCGYPPNRLCTLFHPIERKAPVVAPLSSCYGYF